jgi:hypothetical protein
MLCENNYTQKYIDECRSKIDAQILAYRDLVATAKNKSANDEQLLDTAINAFEPHFFNNMVLVLECYFVHRARAIEKKDGNPLNKMRMLCNLMLNNNHFMCEDKTIKYNPAKSLLKLSIGDEIQVKEADFMCLSSAFFAEIESKYL